jgi:hypothetical protein
VGRNRPLVIWRTNGNMVLAKSLSLASKLLF